MAPDLALAELAKLDPRTVVLDPMAGSGTVIRHASELGHDAFGFDMDPLAVLITRVWTTPVDGCAVQHLLGRVLKKARGIRADNIHLPWIDDDEQSRLFVEYWFAEGQRSDLRRLAFALMQLNRPHLTSAANVLRLALSRLIVTKDQGASLARDVSHSRPHKITETSSFDVLASFE